MTTQTQETSAQELELAWMNEAIRLATDSVANGGGPFGALIAKDGEIVALGNNQVTASLDPTAHAEVSAIRVACKELDTFSLEGCVLVTSCEPCPMCLSSALWARVDRILFSADRDDAAVAGFDDRKFYDLFEKRPASMWPAKVEQLDLPNRTAPFDAWLAKSDRVDY
ncbi:nucleoside deaminase [Streptomyces alkaliterrae]|uniref:Nucleoside deaminase n=1 Tax=Streptomyces alkaliterrae TaxID=2213162 RepID=A0A5P0YW05_9ACTN|nr:nucleoside deaminase [Streptomyces alkaliterrae]MBB1255976.1 nucleoside deaminase [Streptomyces alkaliterrae]MBB1261991.1 nucleoside deaminase [Streptomyces alkaliterrae]MQS04461.1 nucleoside deaminase [Streptomyces alkaliterrae]